MLRAEVSATRFGSSAMALPSAGVRRSDETRREAT
jgi:hypothetical protein